MKEGSLYIFFIKVKFTVIIADAPLESCFYAPFLPLASEDETFPALLAADRYFHTMIHVESRPYKKTMALKSPIVILHRMLTF